MKTKTLKTISKLSVILILFGLTIPLSYGTVINTDEFEEAPQIIFNDRTDFFGASKIVINNETNYSFILDFLDDQEISHPINIGSHGQAILSEPDTNLAFQDSKYHFGINQRVNNETDIPKEYTKQLFWEVNKSETDFWFEPYTEDGIIDLVIRLSFKFDNDHEIKLTISEVK